MALLALDRVRKRYLRGIREVAALEDVSMELYDGDVYGVLGGARSGKTTLLRVAAGIERPDAGSVRFLGNDLASMSRRQRQAMLRSDLGCVWRADSPLRRLPVADHVALPLIAGGTPRLKAARPRPRAVARRRGRGLHGGAAVRALDERAGARLDRPGADPRAAPGARRPAHRHAQHGRARRDPRDPARRRRGGARRRAADLGRRERTAAHEPPRLARRRAAARAAVRRATRGSWWTWIRGATADGP